jgi:hypothetical protein
VKAGSRIRKVRKRELTPRPLVHRRAV